jgi:hypothetical protein
MFTPCQYLYHLLTLPPTTLDCPSFSPLHLTLHKTVLILALNEVMHFSYIDQTASVQELKANGPAVASICQVDVSAAMSLLMI